MGTPRGGPQKLTCFIWQNDDIEKRKRCAEQAVAEQFAGTDDRTKLDSRSQESHEKGGSTLDREEENDYSDYRYDEEKDLSIKEWGDIDNFWNQEGAFDNEVSRVQDAATCARLDYFAELETDYPAHEQEDWGDPYPESEQLKEDYALEAYADDHYNQYDFFFRQGDRCRHNGYAPIEGDVTTLFFTDMFDPFAFCKRLDTENSYQQCLEDSGFMMTDHYPGIEALESYSYELELRIHQQY